MIHPCVARLCKRVDQRVPPISRPPARFWPEGFRRAVKPPLPPANRAGRGVPSPLGSLPGGNTVAAISSDQLARDLAIRDLTDPAAGGHAIQLLIDLAVTALTAGWDCHVRLARGPRVVSLTDNYDALGFAPDAVTRDSRYTRYVDGAHMLRGHATAMIPPALRSLSDEGPEDVLIVCPGITYRRHAIDRLHTGTPHQLDLWRIARHTLEEGDQT